MTSCVFSLFFLLSLCSSITADGPTGLKVRITDKATELLKASGLKYLRELVNKPSQDIPGLKCYIKQFTLTRLDVNPNDVVVRFQPGSGLQFEFRDLSFTAEFQREICMFKRNFLKGPAVLTGERVGVTIGVRLIQPEGRLRLKIPPGDSGCKIQADSIRVDSTGIVGLLLTAVQLRGYIQNQFTSLFCPAVRDLVVPYVNTMLLDLDMESTLSEGHKINLHYYLSRDVTVTSNSLDVPFTGIVYQDYHDDRIPELPAPFVEPVFTDKESNLMAYLGVSEDLFKTAGWALYNHGPFELDSSEAKSFINFFLKNVGLRKGPLQVELTKLPVINIDNNGLSVNVEAIAQSLVDPPPPPLPVECHFRIKVKMNGRRLILQSSSFSKCDAKPGTKKGKFAVVLAKPIIRLMPSLIKIWFKKGIQIPLPDGLDFTQTQIDYHPGYLVVGGDLTFTG
ncbi:hypothetical protein PFLUV_G00184650 [Perca fluviatilis]|uniref:Bactericidal permeability-increasing protein n=1 Tax=Perca fluviatilis TaxID=8168 RepID=A0A6A5DXD7_PERFL|nr:phospholipid transfer protein-like [Perca fluviatilis]XP_039679671.1 phospholipid transfer protein-like [Perca fluviatilis]XP_039679672.1 phospholipid transfer protein-like [Perca fluviatilis]XP_039679673.1 phospholipid transfer protein-like [Perca fluviatilis]XP_039679674.1 phospholipid transfer protein-like [Perca fluviatilis]XP_039679675.1 phospholipid transfer protein-like [Perca fluviatilis]KAF1380227.1 hypothetical protein PFLUV_G00184650 [Perca fluviatilis]